HARRDQAAEQVGLGLAVLAVRLQAAGDVRVGAERPHPPVAGFDQDRVGALVHGPSLPSREHFRHREIEPLQTWHLRYICKFDTSYHIGVHECIDTFITTGRRARLANSASTTGGTAIATSVAAAARSGSSTRATCAT